jgi:hypothetical protein
MCTYIWMCLPTIHTTIFYGYISHYWDQRAFTHKFTTELKTNHSWFLSSFTCIKFPPQQWYSEASPECIQTSGNTPCCCIKMSVIIPRSICMWSLLVRTAVCKSGNCQCHYKIFLLHLTFLHRTYISTKSWLTCLKKDLRRFYSRFLTFCHQDFLPQPVQSNWKQEIVHTGFVT